VFERFTDRARHVLVIAQDEAQLLGHSHIGTEHILLALVREGEGVAARALELLGVRLGDLRRLVEAMVGPADSADSEPTGSPSFTPRAKKVLELSLREALQLGHNYIGTEHMLLGLVREREGVGAQVLKASGVELAAVRQKVIVVISGFGGEVTEASPDREPAPQRTYEEPRCQHCRAAMAANARSRLLLVPDDAGGPPVETTVVYCSACGRGIGAHVEAGPRPAPPDLPA
jgi:ATP-dependent Clp protease ATP-binding subunit ClpA